MKRMNAASFTKQLTMSRIFKDEFGDIVFKRGKKSKMFRFDTDEPEAEFPTIGTIALAGCFFRHVEVCFEFDSAAETASVVCFEGHCAIDTAC
jgi:hypothetical protein